MVEEGEEEGRSESGELFSLPFSNLSPQIILQLQFVLQNPDWKHMQQILFLFFSIQLLMETVKPMNLQKQVHYKATLSSFHQNEKWGRYSWNWLNTRKWIIYDNTLQQSSCTGISLNAILLKGDKLKVEILSLTFEPSSNVALDASVQRVYVEYRLLGVPMETTETPMSLRKPTEGEEIHYNFTRGENFLSACVFIYDKKWTSTTNVPLLQLFMWTVPRQLRSDSISTPCWRALTPTRAGNVDVLCKYNSKVFKKFPLTSQNICCCVVPG